MDLRQRIAGFLATSRQVFGNWTSKENLRERPLDLRREVRAVPVSRNGLDLARLGRDHPGARRFHVIGYDVFQVPVFRLEFVLAGAPGAIHTVGKPPIGSKLNRIVRPPRNRPRQP